MSRKVKKLVLCLGLLLASLFYSYQSAYAVDLSYDIVYVRGRANSTYSIAGSGCTLNASRQYVWTTNNTAWCNISSFTIDLQYNEYLAGDIIEIDFQVFFTNDNDAKNDYFGRMQPDATNTANTSLSLIGVDYEEYSQNTAIAKYYIRVNEYASNMPTLGMSGTFHMGYNYNLSINQATWRPVGDSSQAIINAINNSATNLTPTNNKIDEVVSAIETLQETTEEYVQNQEQAIQDANDRYEDEKQTTYDEAQNGNDNLSTVTGNGFTLPNPIAGIFQYFVSSCSANIPTIASWLGTNQTVYPSWWCSTQKLQNIRSALTVVFQFVAVILTFNFIYRWLSARYSE